MAKKSLPFYNVDASVGKHATNQFDDVMLVQYMLSSIAKIPGHPLPPPTTPLSVDGVASDTLNAWILWFQKCCQALGRNVLVDGRVDPSIPGSQGFYPPAHGHTMASLNATYRRRFRESHDAMERDHNCPTTLRMKFGLYDELAMPPS